MYVLVQCFSEVRFSGPQVSVLLLTQKRLGEGAGGDMNAGAGTVLPECVQVNRGCAYLVRG